MNELMVVFRQNWLYYKTKQTTCEEAWSEVVRNAEDDGINMDNMKPTAMELRDEYGDTIDVIPNCEQMYA